MLQSELNALNHTTKFGHIKKTTNKDFISHKSFPYKIFMNSIQIFLNILLPFFVQFYYAFINVPNHPAGGKNWDSGVADFKNPLFHRVWWGNLGQNFSFPSPFANLALLNLVYQLFFIHLDFRLIFGNNLVFNA